MTCQCPICEKEDVRHLNNHVRMSSDDGHGPQGTYPEGWNKTTGELEHAPDAAGDVIDGDDVDAVDPDADGEALDNPNELDGSDVGLDDHGDDVDEGANGDPADLLDDLEEDASVYNCGNCEHELPYLGGDDRDGGGKQCPECGERLFWSMVEA